MATKKYMNIGRNKHAVSYIDAYGRRWIACPDCVMIASCSVGQRVLAGNDVEYGCCAGALAPGKKMKGESECGGF